MKSNTKKNKTGKTKGGPPPVPGRLGGFNLPYAYINEVSEITPDMYARIKGRVNTSHITFGSDFGEDSAAVVTIARVTEGLITIEDARFLSLEEVEELTQRWRNAIRSEGRASNGDND